MPVLNIYRDVDHISRMKLLRIFPPLLIPAAPVDANQKLTATLVGMMDMPVIPASWLKGHVKCRHLLQGQRGNVALPDKVLSGNGVFLADRER